MEMGNMGGSSSIATEMRDLLEYKPGNGENGWYVVSIGLHNGKLVIQYETSPEKREDELDLAEFKAAADLCAKFRRPSTQLRDEECAKVMPLWPVLVAYPPPGHRGRPLKEAVNIRNAAGYKYFDARVEEISRVEHINAGGKQNCVCTFKIKWLAGPEVGQTTNVQRKRVYLLGFRGLEKHHVLREAAKLVNGVKKYTKSTHDKDTVEAPSMAMTNVSRKSFENGLVVRPNMNMGMSIITDENGYIVCSSQKSSVLEYKPIDNGDDGWYIVSISLRNGFKVVVKYERLAEEREEEIELGKLRSAEDLFVKFRVPSTQVKDEECWKATPLMFVMASYLLPADHGSTLHRYYDAWIEKVFRRNHIFSTLGQEKCMCMFEITWLGGPDVGQRVTVYCESIYLPEFGSIEEHPVLKEASKFLEGREYGKNHSIDKDASLKEIYKSDVGFTCNSYFPSTIIPADTNVWKNNMEDHLVRSSNKRKVESSNEMKRSRVVITEDKNGFIVCSTQPEK